MIDEHQNLVNDAEIPSICRCSSMLLITLLKLLFPINLFVLNWVNCDDKLGKDGEYLESIHKLDQVHMVACSLYTWFVRFCTLSNDYFERISLLPLLWHTETKPFLKLCVCVCMNVVAPYWRRRSFNKRKDIGWRWGDKSMCPGILGDLMKLRLK